MTGRAGAVDSEGAGAGVGAAGVVPAGIAERLGETGRPWTTAIMTRRDPAAEARVGWETGDSESGRRRGGGGALDS